jgi:hypothetical protein
VILRWTGKEKTEEPFGVKAIIRTAGKDNISQIIKNGIDESRKKGRGQAITAYIKKILRSKECRMNPVIMDVLFEMLENLEEKDAAVEAANLIINGFENIIFKKEYKSRTRALVPEPVKAKTTEVPPPAPVKEEGPVGEKEPVPPAETNKSNEPLPVVVHISPEEHNRSMERMDRVLEKAPKLGLKRRIKYVLFADGLNKNERAHAIARVIFWRREIWSNSFLEERRTLTLLDYVESIMNQAPKNKQIERKRIEKEIKFIFDWSGGRD